MFRYQTHHTLFIVLFVGFPRAHGFVEQRRDVLLAVALGGAKHHDPVLDGERVEVVDHHVVIGFGEEGGLAR